MCGATSNLSDFLHEINIIHCFCFFSSGSAVRRLQICTLALATRNDDMVKWLLLKQIIAVFNSIENRSDFLCTNTCHCSFRVWLIDGGKKKSRSLGICIKGSINLGDGKNENNSICAEFDSFQGRLALDERPKIDEHNVRK